MSGLSGDTGATAANFGEMLALMADPAALKARYDEFTKRKTEAEAAIALVGKAADITRMQIEAGKKLAEAEARVKSATEKSNQMISDASSNADRITRDAQAAGQAILDDANKTLAGAKAEAERIAKQSQDLNKAQNALDAQTNQLTAQAAKLTSQEQDLAAREAKVTQGAANLKAVRDAIVAQLAENLKTLRA